MISDEAKFTKNVFGISFLQHLVTVGLVGVTLLNLNQKWPELQALLENRDVLWVVLGVYLVTILMFYFCRDWYEDKETVCHIGLCINVISWSYLLGAFSIWIGNHPYSIFPGWPRDVDPQLFIFHAVLSICIMTLSLMVFAWLTKQIITAKRGVGLICIVSVILALSFYLSYYKRTWGGAIALGGISLVYGVYLVIDIVRIIGKDIEEEVAGAIYIHFDLIILLILLALLVVALAIWCVCAILASMGEGQRQRRDSYVLIKRSDLERLL